MNRLKTKASRFFKDSANRDEKAATADVQGFDFDAGISDGVDSRLKKKPSRLFWKKNDNDKPLPPLPPVPPLPLVYAEKNLPQTPSHELTKIFTPPFTPGSTEKPLPATPALQLETPLDSPGVFDSLVKKPKLRTRSSLATLRSKSSGFLRGTPRNHSPPPPPLPQIPVDYTPPPPVRPTVTPPSRSERFRRRPIKPKLEISRPILSPQPSDFTPTTFARVSFNRPDGPPPKRPARPESLDEDTLMQMQAGGTRIIVPDLVRTSTNTTAESQSSAAVRLGLPSGRTTIDSTVISRMERKSLPRNSKESKSLPRSSKESKSLPRDSEEGAPKKSRRPQRERASRYMSEYMHSIAHHTRHKNDPHGRPGEPMELFNKDVKWKVEERVSGDAGGNPGMLFKDRAGGWHFVADI